MSVLIFDAGDGSGAYDTFAITDAQLNVLHVERMGGSLTRTDYQPDATAIVQVASIVYSLKIDRGRRDLSAGRERRRRRRGAGRRSSRGADVSLLRRGTTARTGRYRSGDRPTARAPRRSTNRYRPTATRQARTARSRSTRRADCRSPRLEVLGASGSGSALVPLADTQLTDGPWCPDETNANRWDADLLRIRKIGVTLRVQAANAALRGPAGVLFANGGTSRSRNRWLPDLQVRFDVTPRNMEFGR